MYMTPLTTTGVVSKLAVKPVWAMATGIRSATLLALIWSSEEKRSFPYPLPESTQLAPPDLLSMGSVTLTSAVIAGAPEAWTVPPLSEAGVAARAVAASPPAASRSAAESALDARAERSRECFGEVFFSVFMGSSCIGFSCEGSGRGERLQP
ncbi:MAG: hypothetical protein ACREFP_05310 [Acetobacteraceae bacterium]